MDDVPFESKLELYNKLYEDKSESKLRRRSTPSSPVQQRKPQKSYLPGEPRIPLDDPGIGQYLEDELVTRALNSFAPHLWLVATQNSAHISSITHQIVRGRNIVITENPELHLCWIYDRVYLKPVPKYLLSHAFWHHFLAQKGASPIPSNLREEIAKAALGLIRSYAFLIRHRSDFTIAQEKRLIPQRIRYHEFVRFLSAFEKIRDGEVSPRFAFGELRLSRLNFWFKLIFRRFAFQKIHGHYSEYFTRFYGPFLFLFAILTVILSAMQVLLQTKTLNFDWVVRASYGVSIFSMFIALIVIAAFLSMFLLLVLRETVFACTDKRRKRRKSVLSGA